MPSFMCLLSSSDERDDLDCRTSAGSGGDAPGQRANPGTCRKISVPPPFLLDLDQDPTARSDTGWNRRVCASARSAAGAQFISINGNVRLGSKLRNTQLEQMFSALPPERTFGLARLKS
jgi:hypothetical protein